MAALLIAGSLTSACGTDANPAEVDHRVEALTVDGGVDSQVGDAATAEMSEELQVMLADATAAQIQSGGILSCDEAAVRRRSIIGTFLSLLPAVPIFGDAIELPVAGIVTALGSAADASFCNGDSVTLAQVLSLIQDRLTASAFATARGRLFVANTEFTAAVDNLRLAEGAKEDGEDELFVSAINTAQQSLNDLDGTLKITISDLSEDLLTIDEGADPEVGLLVELMELRIAGLMLSYQLKATDAERVAAKNLLRSVVEQLSEIHRRHSQRLAELIDESRFQVLVGDHSRLSGGPSDDGDFGWERTWEVRQDGEVLERGLARCASVVWSVCAFNRDNSNRAEPLSRERALRQARGSRNAHIARLIALYDPLIVHLDEEALDPLRAWQASGEPSDFPVFPPPAEGVVQFSGDFDGDGVNEVFHYSPGAREDEHVTLSGDGSPHSFDVDRAFFPGVTDSNGDGRSDIVWYDAESSESLLWTSNGDGTFAESPYEWSPDGQLIGDFDGDAVEDTFFYTIGTQEDFLLLNGDGVLYLQRAPDSSQQAVGDFNGDGSADILWHDETSPTDRTWLSNGDGTFSEVFVSPPTATPLELHPADFNADGLTDVLWVTGTGSDQVAFSNGDGTFTLHEISPDADVNYQIYLQDFDGNGLDDILYYRPGGRREYFFYSQGDGTFDERVRGVDGTYHPFFSDFDQNGTTDIFWYNLRSDKYSYIWFFEGVDSFVQSRRKIYNRGYRTHTGDFNGDGRPDILWSAETQAHVWLKEESQREFADSALEPIDPTLHTESVRDVDSDGLDDIRISPDFFQRSNGDGTFERVHRREADADFLGGDTCDQAVNVTRGGTFPAQTTRGFVRDYDAAIGGCSVSGPDVVYSVTPLVTTRYRVVVHPAATDGAATLNPAVYAANACDFSNDVTGSALRGRGDREEITFTAEAGTTTFIVVDGECGSEGEFVLTVAAE